MPNFILGDMSPENEVGGDLKLQILFKVVKISLS